MDLLRYIIGEFSVIRAAPVSFMLSIVAVGLLLFSLMTWGYGRENSYLRTQLDDYKEKLKGATPQEAKDKIDQLQKTADLVIGKAWVPLTASEIDALAIKLKPLVDQFTVQIMYENTLGQSLAQSLFDAFKKAGWTKYRFNTGSGLGPGISVGVGSDSAARLKSIIEGSTTLKVGQSRPAEEQWGDLVYLAVGINNGLPNL